jgi:hypothetical protein
VVAHGRILRIYEKKPLVADQVAVNYRKPTSRAPACHARFRDEGLPGVAPVGDEDFPRCTRTGFSDEDIWDIAPSRRSSVCRTGWRASRT